MTNKDLIYFMVNGLEPSEVAFNLHGKTGHAYEDTNAVNL